jgi:hypothetical protein
LEQGKQFTQQIDTLKNQTEKLKNELEDEQSRNVCVICFERNRDTILLPCKKC